MVYLFPAAIKAQGNVSVTIVSTIATMSAPSLATEINAASSVDASGFIVGTFSATSTTNRGEAPRRLGATESVQEFGQAQHEIADWTYIYDPQAIGTADANKVKTALAPGSTVYLVVRRGLSAEDTAYAATQKVKVHKVRCGERSEGQTGDGEFDQLAITQALVDLVPPVEGTIAA